MFKKLISALLIFYFFFPTFLMSGELTGLQEIQNFQKDFDQEHFEINTGFEKLRHVFLHLVKTTGKMATYCESMEHGRKTDPSEVIHEALPDLLIHALQIANYYDINLSEEYVERIQFLINRSNQK